MRIVGSRYCISVKLPDGPNAAFAVASSPLATASKYLRTNASAGCARTATAGGAVGTTVGGGVRAAIVGRAAGSCVGSWVAVAVAVGVAATVGFAVAVALGEGFGVRAAVALAAGAADGVALGDAFALADVDAVGVGGGVAIACATEAIGVGVCTTTSGVRFCGGGVCRAANAESSAPIPKPAMITPAKSGTIGKPPRSSSSLEERRRRGGPDRELMSSQRSTRDGLALDGLTHVEAKRQAEMIRVSVPIDLGTAITADASAFAMVTPIRVATLIELAVVRVLGRRAPPDKCARAIRTTLAGLRNGSFALDIDGKLINDPDKVVVCSGSATLRFFAHRTVTSAFE
jgi:hypothetical protein